MLAGVDLGEQQLEYRFVGRVYPLVQLPETGADKLTSRYASNMAKVQALLPTDKPLAEQALGVAVVVLFFVSRHQPPKWIAAAEENRSTVELVEQQIVLGGAAVIRGQLRFALALGEARGVD